MRIVAAFSQSYSEAREKFREAATAAGANLKALPHPSTGPGGEPLAMDVAWIGPRDASRVLVLTSGTHGIEGYGGSGLQVAWLREGRAAALPSDAAVLLVHGVNPHGFAWSRRVNEDNVDLNRNFIDHDREPPRNDGYAELADAIKPIAWDEASLATAQRVLEDFIARHGVRAFQQAATGGQYSHPDGIFYGGRAPTWSNRTLRRLVRDELSGARRIAVADFHTGLGPFGHGEIISPAAPGSPGAARAVAWFGAEAKSPDEGTSASAAVVGVLVDAFPQEAPGAEVTSIGLEFGTHPILEVLHALRQDNWLHAHGDPTSAQGRDMKAYIRERFYPADDRWKDLVWARADEVVGRTLRAVTAS